MNIQLKDKYVAFLDVLGFTSIVNSPEPNGKLENYFNSVEKIFMSFPASKSLIKYFIISDSIILIAEDTEEEFKNLLAAISLLQANLAQIDIWIRGGVAFGPVHFEESEKIIVGTGYINAYLLEKDAIYPRVVIDPSILSKLGITLKDFYLQYNGPFYKHHPNKLIHDYGQHIVRGDGARLTSDDAIFVSYAHKIVVDTISGITVQGNTPLNIVYNNLKTNLYGTQKHYHKYLWVKKYFMETLREWSSQLASDNIYPDESSLARLNTIRIQFSAL
jgi:hypothetical protein